MKLKGIVNTEFCGQGGCPTVYVDEESGDFFLQGYKVEDSARINASCPTNEDLVRVPASFWERIKAFAKESK